MRKLFLVMTLSITAAMPIYAVTTTSASAGMVTTAMCNRNPGDFLGADGQCHTADEKGKVAPASTNVVNHPAAGNNPGVVDKQFTDFNAFKADCEANNGHIYTAEDWNKRGIQPHLNPGQMQCYRDPSWS